MIPVVLSVVLFLANGQRVQVEPVEMDGAEECWEAAQTFTPREYKGIPVVAVLSGCRVPVIPEEPA